MVNRAAIFLLVFLVTPVTAQQLPYELDAITTGARYFPKIGEIAYIKSARVVGKSRSVLHQTYGKDGIKKAYDREYITIGWWSNGRTLRMPKNYKPPFPITVGRGYEFNLLIRRTGEGIQILKKF